MKKSPASGGPARVEERRRGEEFERLAQRYELYVPWKTRLAREIPFLAGRLRAADAKTVLDVACGPGRHAVALAKEGFEVTGLDASPTMLALARRNASDHGVTVELLEGRFEALSEAVDRRFDAALCLGNSLSAVENEETVQKTLLELREVLRPGGIAITQTVDFDVVAPEPVNPSPVRHVQDGDLEHLFVKSFVRVGEQVFIHWVSLEGRGGTWSSEVTFHPMFVLKPRVLMNLYADCGFEVEAYGDYAGGAYQAGRSRDLIVVATSPPHA